MRIGVDVGGTNTDAVLVEASTIRESIKMPTTRDVGDGIVNAIAHVIEAGGVTPSDIEVVSIGTTHFTNAFVQRRSLDRVGAIRVALPASSALPPLTDWPSDLCAQIGDNHIMVRGGYQYDGRINSELDEDAIIAAAKNFKDKGIDSIAISGLFAPVNDAMERRTEELIRQTFPESTITLSSGIGRIGLLERENAGIMNASLASLARSTVSGFKNALRTLGITAPFYVSQNDGTLMSADFVEQYPVLTFASGPTNSMRGAAYLSGIKEAIVADIGGTTTDIGVLNGGFPRESSIMVDIGGVKTNFRMPDVLAIGLGGGSIVSFKDGDVQIGPQSVGYEITQKSLVFGGDTLTATDIAVAAGYADIGDPSLVSHLPAEQVEAAVAKIHLMLEDSVDRMKTSRADVPLILVGGGSVLINRDISGVSEIVRDPNAGVANAIGASIAMVSGEVDRVYSYETMGRDAALEAATTQANTQAIEAGAHPGSLSIADIEELPLAYMPGGAVRLRVKVVGELQTAGAN